MRSRFLSAQLLPALFFACACCSAEEFTTVTLGGDAGIVGLEPVPLSGVSVQTETVEAADGPRAARRLVFDKRGEERRLVALQVGLANVPEGLKAMSLRCRLKTDSDAAHRIALVCYETDGGTWFRTGSRPFLANDFREVRLPLTSLSRATFASDSDDSIRWDQINRVWVGIVIDGPSKGVLEISQAVLTDEPYRPEGPLSATNGGVSAWTVSQDPAVKATLTTSAEGPDKKPCMKTEFSFPGGRHMYVVPRTPLRDVELGAYQGLRFTYRATLPNGINGLLVMLLERDGTQYFADPAPGPAKDWTTVTIPFPRFKHGTWSPDENNRLDLNDIDAVAVGVHGTASETRAAGFLQVTDIEFVP